MFGVSKYDILEKEEEMTEKKFIEILGDMIDTEQEYKKTLNEFELHDALAKKCWEISENVIRNLIKLSHYTFENAKDLNAIDGRIVYRFLRDNNLDSDTFINKYSSIFDKQTFCLIAGMIIDDEDIDLESYIGVDLSDCFMRNDFSKFGYYLRKNGFECKNESNLRIIEKMKRKDFSVMMLERDEMDRLIEYHNNYMKRKIYPRITRDVEEKDRILLKAKKVGARKA